MLETCVCPVALPFLMKIRQVGLNEEPELIGIYGNDTWYIHENPDTTLCNNDISQYKAYRKHTIQNQHTRIMCLAVDRPLVRPPQRREAQASVAS